MTVLIGEYQKQPVMTKYDDIVEGVLYEYLKGVDDPAGQTTDGTFYVLNYKAGTGVGFYKLASGNKVGYGKAYLKYSGSLVREFFAFDEDDADGIVSPLGETEEGAAIYNLSGQRVTPHRGGGLERV